MKRTCSEAEMFIGVCAAALSPYLLTYLITTPFYNKTANRDYSNNNLIIRQELDLHIYRMLFCNVSEHKSDHILLAATTF